MKVVANLGAGLAQSNGHMNIRFRPDIEGLRAVAVILVVLYHAGLPFLQGGFVGVDMFFVVSGYLITSLLAQELNSSGGINLSRFYARRARRLLPALTLVVVIVCLIQSMVASPLVQMDVLKAALATILYSSNLYFAHLQLYYFLQSSGSEPLLHTWSLAVEEQFYLVWPIFLLLLEKPVRGARSRVLVIAATTIISFAGCVWLTAENQVMAFFLSPSRAWEFSIGGLLAFLPLRWMTARENLCKWLGAAGLITLVLCGALMTDSASFPGYVAAIPVLATLTVLQAGAATQNSLSARVLKWRPLQYVGGISYSLYLWHWPVLMIVPQIVSNDSAVVRAVCILLSVALAAVTHVTVENPIRFNSFLGTRSVLSLGLVGLSMTLCIGGLAMWWIALNHSAQFRKFHEARNDVPSFYRTGCTAELRATDPRQCSFGELAKPESTVVLFGDSHAAQWFPAMKVIAESRHWKLVTIIKSACSPMNISILRDPRVIKACQRWRELAITTIQEMHPDTVVMSSSSLYQQRDSPRLIDVSDWEKGSRETFLAIAGHGIALRFIRDTPHSDYDVPPCLAQLAWNGHATCPPLSRSNALSSDIYQAEVRAASDIPNVKLIDMSDAICGRNSCETEQGGLVKFRDSDHLTSRYAESLAKELQIQLLNSLK
jgi:peptidoglycan/LPS O-acetylase OafA/YrhL